MNKPVLPLEVLEGSIAHIEQLKSKTEAMLGPKNLLADAVISMDFAGHSYDYSELLVMRDGALDLAAMNATTTTAHQAWNNPEDAMKSIRLAQEKMQLLDEERTRLIREHQAKYGRDLFMEAHQSLGDGLGMPHRFIYDEYLAKKDITPVWAEKIWPELQRYHLKRARSPERVATIQVIDP